MRHGDGTFYFSDDMESGQPHRRLGTWIRDKLDGVAQYVRGQDIQTELW